MAGTLQDSASEWIWKDGDWIPWADANVHLLSTAVQFGTSMFEGIRCYETAKGPAIFRLERHLRRLIDSCTIYRMVPDWSVAQLAEACTATVRKNGLSSCYLRPMILRGYGAAGLDARNSPIESWIAAWAWGAYLGADALEKGVDICTSSWMRAHPNTFPTAAKAAGNYVNAQLIKMEAIANGYAEGVAVGPNGLISEGGGQNIFLVRDGILFTPFLDGTSLAGITRDAVMTLARDFGIEVREQHVPRESLYTADEVFFTGTASEVTPVRSVDRIEVGAGSIGPITHELQRRFLSIAQGKEADPHGWLTYVG